MREGGKYVGREGRREKRGRRNQQRDRIMEGGGR